MIHVIINECSYVKFMVLFIK